MRAVVAVVVALVACGCEGEAPGRVNTGTPSETQSVAAQTLSAVQSAAVVAAVDSAVWSFRDSDIAMDPGRVLAHLWPDFTMLADGSWTTYDEVAAGTHELMAGLAMFETEWSELKIIPLGVSTAISAFQFRDSILTRSGELIQTRGPTTLIWEQREGEWRIPYADADHYPLEAGG